jgi:hypothetical protein
MTSAATIAAKLILDQTDYDKGLNQANSKADTFASKLTSIGSKMAITGGVMTAGLTTPILEGFKQITDAASDLGESTNAMKVVFGDASKTMENFGKVSATSVGMSTADFNQMGAKTGAMLTNFGLDQETAAKETVNLSKRAADMASIFNTDVASAMAAVQSGLRGETEPLRAYGVSLDAAAVKAKILAMGLDTSTPELEKQAKATASLALFYEQTSKFSGDFANTSDQLANASRINSAEFANVAASLGTQLLPYMLEAMKFISGIIEGFKNLTPEQQKWIVGIGLLVAAIGPVLMILGTLATAIGAIIPVVTAVAGVITFPLIAIIAAVAAAIALFAVAWANNWGGIRDKTMPIINWLVGNFQTFLEVLGKIWSFITTYIAPIIKALAQVELAILGKAFDVIRAVFEKYILPYFETLWKTIVIVMDKMKPLTDWLNNNLAPAFSGIGDKILAAIDGLSKLADWINNTKLPDWLTGGTSLTITGTATESATSIRGANMASGGSFIVPSGFPNDTFPVNVTSGEKVTVDKAGTSGAPFDYDRMALSFRDALLQVQK